MPAISRVKLLSTVDFIPRYGGTVKTKELSGPGHPLSAWMHSLLEVARTGEKITRPVRQQTLREIR